MNEIATKIISAALTGMLMLSALAVTAMPSAAAEAPVIPTAFYGNVTVNGASAPVNTTITGRIVSAAGSPGNGSITTTEAGKYGGSEWYDPKLVVQTDSSDDISKTIEFYVQLPSWGAARKANETATYDSAAQAHNLDLSVSFTCNLTINSTAGGSVTTPGEGTFTYNASEVVSLVAAADTNYSFVNWTGDVGTIANVNSATTNITMNDNYTITANFAAVVTTYNLTITSTAGGSVTTPGEGTFTYNASEVVALVAAAATNYSFVNWTGDVGTIANVNSATTNITMNGNYSITANFAAVVSTATLEGHVTFTGRGSNNTKWAEPFNVTLFEAGNLSHAIWTGNATTNNTGVFTVSGLTAGTYDIGVKNWTCLSEMNTSVTLTAGMTTVVDFGTTREGDANNDDYVNILDASSLVPCYGSSTGDPDWNPYCDFNRDGNINILDASALASNYGKHGDLV